MHVYTRLREQAPVFRIKAPGNEVGWRVTRGQAEEYNRVGSR